MLPYIKRNWKNGGAIPGSHQCKEFYFPILFQAKNSQLNEELKGKSISILIDETPDALSRQVVNVLAEYNYPSRDSLINTAFFSSTNY